MTAQTPCETCCETWWAVLKHCNLSYTKTRIRSTITSYCITWRIWRTEYVPITMIPINYFAMSSVWRQEKGGARQTSGHRTENKAPSEAAEKPWNSRMWFQHTPKKMYIYVYIYVYIFDLLVEYAEYAPCKIIMPYWLWHLRTGQCWFAGTRSLTMCIQYKFCKYVQLMKMFPFNKSSLSTRLSVRLQSCLTWRVSMKSLHFIPTLASTLLSDQETRAITSRSVGWSPQAQSD